VDYLTWSKRARRCHTIERTKRLVERVDKSSTDARRMTYIVCLTSMPAHRPNNDKLRQYTQKPLSAVAGRKGIVLSSRHMDGLKNIFHGGGGIPSLADWGILEGPRPSLARSELWPKINFAHLYLQRTLFPAFPEYDF